MLVVRAVEDQPSRGIRSGDIFRITLVDAHHHMGREGSHRNTPAGAYSYYALLWFELRRMAKDHLEKDGLLFEPIQVEPPSLPWKCFNLRDSWERMNNGWLVDRTIVFPYSDDYAKSTDRTIASFRLSNDKIAGWTTHAPNSTRLIGFARVDPTEGKTKSPDTAVNELNRAVSDLGLRGLKLHPLAQLFLDDIQDDITKRVVKRAGELRIPVIFDTRNIRTARKIKALVDDIRSDRSCSEAVRGLRVILAHCAMSPGDPLLHEILRDPLIYAETSGLHGQDIPVLFKMAQERAGTNRASWAEKILFGTDYSFLSMQAAEVIMYLLSKSFSGTLADMQRILGGNALSIVQKPFATRGPSGEVPRQVVFSDERRQGLDTLESLILNLVRDRQWDVASIDFMIPPKGTWPDVEPYSTGGFSGVYTNSYVITLISDKGAREVHVWVRQQSSKTVSCAVMSSRGEHILDTTEFASQRVDQFLLSTLAERGVEIESLDRIPTALLGLLQTP